MMGVLIDTVPPVGPRALAGVGAAAFVSRAFVDQERADPHPGLTERVLEAVLAGRSVALTPGEIAAANAAEGLNVAVILHHWQTGLSDGLQREVRRHLIEKFLQDLKGYRILEVLAEGRDDAELAWCLAGGFHLRHPGQGGSVGHREPCSGPFIVGITREEGLASEGCILSLLFHHSPPRLRFTASQRRMLMEAVQHRTDVQIASVLGVSVSAVKKLWAGIFEKAAALLDDDARMASRRTTRATRGAQKRHVLLTYLQEHPEELRP
jgi:DNA-binding CsgD family transcriptional regulator